MTSIEVRSGGVETSPLAVDTGTGWVEVEKVVERWRVEVGWWRVEPEHPVLASAARGWPMPRPAAGPSLPALGAGANLGMRANVFC